MLEDDAYTTDVSPHRVTCKACGTSIRLDTTYKYEGSHWRAHRARCPQIPFHERVSKKRRSAIERRTQGLTYRAHHAHHHHHHHPSGLENTFGGTHVLDKAAVTTDSSDSDDSDASSVPRPRPTSFLTAPLVINPTKMFNKRRRVLGPSTGTTSGIAAAVAEDNAAHLIAIAADIAKSDRLTVIINSAGQDLCNPHHSPSTTSEVEQQEQQGRDGYDTAHPAEDAPTYLTNAADLISTHAIPSPLSPARIEVETWMGRKRTREEDAEFDAFFNRRAVPPMSPPPPHKKLRVCKLGKDAMIVVD